MRRRRLPTSWTAPSLNYKPISRKRSLRARSARPDSPKTASAFSGRYSRGCDHLGPRLARTSLGRGASASLRRDKLQPHRHCPGAQTEHREFTEADGTAVRSAQSECSDIIGANTRISDADDRHRDLVLEACEGKKHDQVHDQHRRG
jgi:hypothetical protein